MIIESHDFPGEIMAHKKNVLILLSQNKRKSKLSRNGILEIISKQEPYIHVAAINISSWVMNFKQILNNCVTLFSQALVLECSEWEVRFYNAIEQISNSDTNKMRTYAYVIKNILANK